MALEFLTGHLEFLKKDVTVLLFQREIYELDKAVTLYKKSFFDQKLMEHFCGHCEGIDHLYADAVRCCQYQKKNPWISLIFYGNIDKSCFKRNYWKIDHDTMNYNDDFRNELRDLIDEGKLKFKDTDEGLYIKCLRQALTKYIVQEIKEQVEARIKEQTGEKVSYEAIGSLLMTSYDFPTGIKTISEARSI